MANSVAQHYGKEGYGAAGAKKGPNTKRKLGRATSSKAKLGMMAPKKSTSARSQSAAARRKRRVSK